MFTIGRHHSPASSFTGSVSALTAELAVVVSGLRVRSAGLRFSLQHATESLQVAVGSGSWATAVRSAKEISRLLSVAAQRRLTDVELAVWASRCALRVAALAEARQ